MKHLKEKTELKKIINTFDKDYDIYKKNNSPFNEQMTRQQYIDQLLRLLGWDITNPNNFPFNDREIVAEEYSSRSDRPDYTIRMNGSSLFYVEAKKVNVAIEIEPEPALQVRRYGWNGGHEISVLTNFEYLSIYTTFNPPEENDGVANSRYKIYRYNEYIDKFDEIYELLSRESVLDGKFSKWTTSIKPSDATKLSLDKVFLEQLNEWRILIGDDLYKNPSVDYQDMIQLNESVQTFLNQLIFLRFAEDNQFEDAKELENAINKHVDFKSYFRSLDKKYNSGIFEDSDVIINISNSTLKEIVENLYFPSASYDFSVIDLSILSRIYENFLQEELYVEDNKIRLKKTENVKVKSVVSTPDDIVRLMVQKALKEKITGLSPKDILNLKIADLAVGSGIFLIESYNYIENYLVDWYAQSNEVFPNPYLVPFVVKRSIIQNVFRGYDINNQAVQLTKFSLLLRLLTYEKKERVQDVLPLLPSLDNSIINGNSLIDEEDLNITKLNNDDFTDISPMHNSNFKDLKFDIILGNPPYLQTKEILDSTTNFEVDVYKTKYYSVYKQYDKYFMFIERSLDLVKKDGVVILLIPNKFFITVGGSKLRELVVSRYGISFIIDFKSIQLFKEKNNYLAIIQFSNFDDDKFEYSVVNSIESAFSINKGLTYKFDDLENSHWFLTENPLLRKSYKFAMTNLPNVETAVISTNGIQTSANDIYMVDKKYKINEDDEIISFCVKKKNKFEEFSIEKVLLKEFYQTKKNIQGKSYMPLISSTYVIFPYIDGKVISEECMKEKFPNTLSYFNKHKDRLLPKSMGGNKRDVQNVTEWYQYGRSQFLKESNEDKIIVGVLSNQPNFNIDRSGMLIASGGTAGYIALMKREDSPYSLEYIQAWLSHPFTDMIFRTIGSNFENGFYTHGTATYKDVPLLTIDFADKVQFSKYNQIVAYVKEIEIINNQIKQGVSDRISKIKERQKQNYISNINLIFDELIRIRVGE